MLEVCERKGGEAASDSNKVVVVVVAAVEEKRCRGRWRSCRDPSKKRLTAQ